MELGVPGERDLVSDAWDCLPGFEGDEFEATPPNRHNMPFEVPYTTASQPPYSSNKRTLSPQSSKTFGGDDDSDDGESSVWSSTTPSVYGTDNDDMPTSPQDVRFPGCAAARPSCSATTTHGTLGAATGCEERVTGISRVETPELATSEADRALVGDVTIGCTFDLRTKQWHQRQVPALVPHGGFSISSLSSAPFSSLSSKGRHSKDERESDRRAQEILRCPDWSVTAKTTFEDLECLISALVRYLGGAVTLEKTPLAWCAGGSLDATLKGRNDGGCTHLLRFALCERSDWTGDRKTTKVGNTCRWHAGGLRVSNVIVGGAHRPQVVLRKCTWMKCCYGRKHYGDPPSIPWCRTCEYQKKVERKMASNRRSSVHGGAVSGALAAPLPEPCDGCLSRLLSEPQRRFCPCGSCMKLLERVDLFAEQLTQAAKSGLTKGGGHGQPSTHSVCVASGGGGGSIYSTHGTLARAAASRSARVNALVSQTGGGLPDAGVAIAPLSLAALDPAMIKQIMLRVLVAMDLRAQAKQAEPILIDALMHRFDATNFDTLWSSSAQARTALSRMVLDDIGLAAQLHRAMLSVASQPPPNTTTQFLRAVPIQGFFSCWQNAGSACPSAGGGGAPVRW
eukprot:COSAG01_NODE_1210_length_11227_cov_46.803019_1_plen_623_part_00